MIERRVSIQNLWTQLALDPFYGDITTTRRLIGQIDNSVRIRKPWLRHPGQVVQADLVHAWCAQGRLDTYPPRGEGPTGWHGRAYAEHVDSTLEVDRENLKQFLLRQRLPLPMFWFPGRANNTENWKQGLDVTNNLRWEKASALSEVEEQLGRLCQFTESLSLADPEYLRRTKEAEAEIARLNAEKTELELFLLGHAKPVEPTPDRRRHRRRDQQLQAILDAIKKLSYDTLGIPFGGKRKIRGECLRLHQQFTPASFEHAWREAKKRGLVQVQNIERYKDTGQ